MLELRILVLRALLDGQVEGLPSQSELTDAIHGRLEAERRISDLTEELGRTQLIVTP